MIGVDFLTCIWPCQIDWARGVMADAAHHDDATLLRAARMLERDGSPTEATRARDLICIIEGERNA